MLLLSGPNMGGNELKYVTECIETGWVSSVGSYVDRFEKMSAEFAGTKYAVATSSGSTALHICLILADVQANDMVIAPNITFVATLNSIKYTGAAPILIDTDEKTWQMDLDVDDKDGRSGDNSSLGVIDYATLVPAAPSLAAAA